jgi:hypothetical protein
MGRGQRQTNFFQEEKYGPSIKVCPKAGNGMESVFITLTS